MKKSMLSVALFALLVGFAAAGGQSEHASATATKSLSALWFYDDPAEISFLSSAIHQYTTDHPGVDIHVNTVTFADLYTKVAQLVAGGSAPDIVKLTQLRPEFQPFLQNLSDYLGPDFLKPFIKGVAAAMVVNGKVVGAPLDVTANGIILNKSLFAKAGVAIPSENNPWTWSEFLARIEQVRKATGVKWALVWDFTPHRWLTYLYENGGSVFAPDGKSVAFDSPATVKALDGFATMFKQGIIPLSTWAGSEDPRSMFFSGQTVAWMSGSWQVKAMVDGLKSFDWTAGPNPYVTTRSSVLGYKFVSTFSTAKHPRQAADFIKFFTSKEVNAAYARTLLTIPARTDLGTVDYGNPGATEALNNLGHELSISPLVASTDVANPAMAYVWDPLKNNIVDVIIGKKTAEQAIAAVDAAANKGLNATQGK